VPPSASRDAGLGLLVAGMVWELSHWWPGVRLELVLPVGLVTAGVGMGWRGSDDAMRSDPRRGTGVLGRVLGGLVLCIGGLAVFFGQQVDVATLRDTGLALGVAFAGAGLVLGPSAVRLVRSFSVERDERIRAQERARVAAHLHDSVLQTLTLIQKRAEDPAATATLARHQERSLRRWLYGGGAAGADGEVEPGGEGWRRAAERMVGEVEDRYSVAVELVMVGDGEVDDARTPAVAALLAASREALVNAAKFSGVAHLSMYCELADGRFEVFVRDRGKGFDPTTIPADRRGIRDSIVGRVRGVGGTAHIRSEAAAGTEVQLSLPVRPGRG
jgi:signal transduction histidine kinase